MFNPSSQCLPVQGMNLSLHNLGLCTHGEACTHKKISEPVSWELFPSLHTSQPTWNEIQTPDQGPQGPSLIWSLPQMHLFSPVKLQPQYAPISWHWSCFSSCLRFFSSVLHTVFRLCNSCVSLNVTSGHRGLFWTSNPNQRPQPLPHLHHCLQSFNIDNTHFKNKKHKHNHKQLPCTRLQTRHDPAHSCFLCHLHAQNGLGCQKTWWMSGLVALKRAFK